MQGQTRIEYPPNRSRGGFFGRAAQSATAVASSISERTLLDNGQGIWLPYPPFVQGSTGYGCGGYVGLPRARIMPFEAPFGALEILRTCNGVHSSPQLTSGACRVAPPARTPDFFHRDPEPHWRPPRASRAEWSFSGPAEWPCWSKKVHARIGSYNCSLGSLWKRSPQHKT